MAHSEHVLDHALNRFTNLSQKEHSKLFKILKRANQKSSKVHNERLWESDELLAAMDDEMLNETFSKLLIIGMNRRPRG